MITQVARGMTSLRLIVASLILFASPVWAQKFMGVDQNSPYPIYLIDSANAAATQTGNLSFQSYTLAKHPQTQLFYAVENVAPYRVATWNSVTKALTIINSGLGIPLTPRLGFRIDGTLYATRLNTSQLYRINTTNGTPTLVGTITNASNLAANSGDLAFSPAGVMYLVSEDRLYTVDLSSLRATLVGTTGTANLPGLAFLDNGQLYAVSIPGSLPDSKLYRLSTTNAQATLIGNTGRRIFDLANEYTSFPPVMALAKTVTPSTVLTGGTVTYTITATNTGSGAATVTQIKDLLPAGFSYINGTTTGVTTLNPTIAGQTLTWNGTFTVPAKVGTTNGTITLTFNAKAGTTRGVFPNNATVSGSNFNILNTGDVAPVTVTAAEISLTKSVTPSTAKPGEQITYTVLYRNLGTATAHTLVIVDPIPDKTTFVNGSMRIGNAASTYATAQPKTDVAGDDEATYDGTKVVYTFTTVAATDGVTGSGADEGKVYFKVVVQ